MTSRDATLQSLPQAIYVWLVRSEEVQDQPGSWRIRKWDTEPFPEANFTISAEARDEIIEQCANVCESRAGSQAMAAFRILMSAASSIRDLKNKECGAHGPECVSPRLCGVPSAVAGSEGFPALDAARADRLFADKEQLAAEVMSMRDELAAVYKCERKLIDTLRDVLRDRLTQTNLHQMPPAMRKRLEDARRLLAALGG